MFTLGSMEVHDAHPVFYHLGRIIAVLELGARSHEARWVHLYYANGAIPWAGLRDALQTHQQSVGPALERRGTGKRYVELLDRLVADLQRSASVAEPLENFGSWATAVLSYEEGKPETGIPTSSLPQDMVDYARGYLDQRRDLQPSRPAAPVDATPYCWNYHQGRLMPWKGAGNDPRLSEAFQLGLKDQRALNPKQDQLMRNSEQARLKPED